MHSQLALTAEQKAELAPFEEAYEAQRNRVTKDIHAAGKDLADAVRRGQRDSSAIAEALDRIRAARSLVMRTLWMIWCPVIAVLTLYDWLI